MHDFGGNPMVISEGDSPSSGEVPLVLVHDGSGLVYDYLCLSRLSRPVYAFYDPSFFSEREWRGGIPEMAACYYDLMHEEVPPGQILLGGM